MGTGSKSLVCLDLRRYGLSIITGSKREVSLGETHPLRLAFRVQSASSIACANVVLSYTCFERFMKSLRESVRFLVVK